MYDFWILLPGRFDIRNWHGVFKFLLCDQYDLYWMWRI
jgi:hypothetical protein